jgi:HTH-type transcriptional regulator/antitoxin HipB
MEEVKQLPPNCTPIEEHFEQYYGKRGTPEREAFETEARAFMIAELLKEERRLANMTQEDLAQKTGTKKSLIARLERGKIELSNAMLQILFETGFGKRVSFNL